MARGSFTAFAPVAASAGADNMLVAVPQRTLPAGAPMAPDGESPLVTLPVVTADALEVPSQVQAFLTVLDRDVLDGGRVFTLHHDGGS